MELYIGDQGHLNLICSQCKEDVCWNWSEARSQKQQSGPQSDVNVVINK